MSEKFESTKSACSLAYHSIVLRPLCPGCVGEAGLGFAVSWDKPGGFIGQSAAIEAKSRGNLQRCINMQLQDASAVLYGNETIRRDGEVVGFLSSTAYGHSVGATVGMGLVTRPDGEPVTADFVKSGEWSVDYNGELYGADASLRPYFDPKAERVHI